MLLLMSMAFAKGPLLHASPLLPPWVDLSMVAPPIVNGQTTSDYPEVPMLYMRDRSGYGALCTGSLIAPEWVLTAAHCVTDSSDFRIYAIDVGFGYSMRSMETTTVAEDWIPHPYYNGSGYYDVALIKLAKPIEDYPLMRLSVEGFTSQDRGEEFRVVGFGATSDDDQGTNTAKRYTDLPLAYYDERLFVTWDQAGGSNNSNACHGDSGGPVLRMYDNGSYAEAGIVNFAAGNTQGGDCEGNGVANARVDYYLSWIEGYTPVKIFGETPVEDVGSYDEIEIAPPLGPMEMENPTRPKAAGENYDTSCNSVSGLSPMWLGIVGLLGLRRRRA